ncbi:MAG TPA: PIG-L family deacetylase [Anaerolineae bacterium]
MILFVSPHLDDIALSCGGIVHRLAHSGEQVIIATLCTADAPAGQLLSPSAQHEHWQWQLGAQPYQFRRQEDERMAALLGAQPVHLGLLDAIYRHDGEGAPLYEGKQFMAGQVHPWDWAHQLPAVLAALQGVLDAHHPQRVFCPLTAGGHVDHIIARRAVEQLCDARTLAYYEDYPYAQKDAAALARLLSQGQDWRPMLIQLSEEEILTRIAAINCYQSQLFAVFGDASTMPARVREYIAFTGGERYWERM